MSNNPPSFEQWVAFCCSDHRTTDSVQWMVYDDPDSAITPCDLAAYIRRLFLDAKVALQSFSKMQVAAAVGNIAQGTAGIYDALDSCRDDRTIVEIINAIPVFFRDYLAPLCRPQFPSWDDPEAALEGQVFMFFDSWLIRAVEHGHSLYRPAAVQPMLAALQQVLAIDHVAMQYAALHGLGHAHRAGLAPQVKTIIDGYLRTDPPHQLRAFAMDARRGEML